MVSYLLNRFFSGVLSLTTLVVIIASIIYISPVDPATLSFGQQMNQTMLEEKRKELLLDKPISTQVASYLNDLSPISVYKKQVSQKKDLKGWSIFSIGESAIWIKLPYFRKSFQTGDSVWSMVVAALPNTLILAFIAILLATIIGVFFGVIAALNRGTWIDGAIVGLSTLGYSVPSYVSAIIFSLLFGFVWREYTGLGMQGSLITLNDIGDEVIQWKNIILPSLALGVRPVAVITQICRTTMIDILGQSFVLTARSKGLTNFQVIKNHVFKNILNPLLTSISGWFAALLAGAFFVESIFNYNGMGLLTVNALINYDTPLLLGCIVVIATLFIIMNILLDFAYQWIDPRVRIKK